MRDAAFYFMAAGLVALVTVPFARWLDVQSWRRALVAYRLSLPANLTADDVAAWLGHVVAGTHAPWLGILPTAPVWLEVVASPEGITHMLLVHSGMEGTVLSGLRAAAPGVRPELAPAYLLHRPRLTMAAEGRLTHLSRPLAHDRAERTSTGMLAALQPLRPGEYVCLQWTFLGATTPAPAPGRDSAGTVLDLLRGEGPTVDSEALRAARLKQTEPLLQAVVRCGVSAGNQTRVRELFGRVWGSLRGLNAPGAQVVRRSLPSGVVADRLTKLAVPLLAWPMILNTRELAGLLGLPFGGVALPGLPRSSARQLPPPHAMATHGTVVATSTYPGMGQRPLALATEDRLRHTWCVGPTGTGKSTLLASMILQDIQAGRCVAVIDPKGGDLVRDVLDRIPPERQGDVVVLDPSVTDRPVGLNLLDLTGGEHAEELAVDHLVHLMSSLWSGSWGPRTSDVLRIALLTLTHTRAADGSRFTLVELPELLLNPTFRQSVVRQPGVPVFVRPFWAGFEEMSDGERAQVIGPSLNKLRSFTTRTALRLMLGQSHGIRLDEVFTKRRILLVALPDGIIGTDTAAIVASFVMAGLWQASLARVAVPAAQRHPVFFYVDEFQSAVRLPVDLTDMLAKARGLGVGLVLAHQYLGQLTDTVRTAVLGTARTQIAFQVEHDDAKALAQRFAPLTQADLSGLAAFEIAMRPCVGGATLAPVTGRTLPLPAATTDGAALAAAARERFGVPRAEVEAALQRRVEGPARQRGRGRVRTGDEA
jgi:hypothetical protein